MSLSAWLLLIPQWISILLVVGFFTAFGMVVKLLVRRFIHHSVLKQLNETAGFVYATMGVIYGVLLAFLVIMVWEHYNDATTTAEKEAMYAYTLYRDMAIYPDKKEVEPALTALAVFVRSVVEKEYPAMKNMEWEPARIPSVETEENFNSIWQSINKIAPKTMQEQSFFNEILKGLNILGQEREKRIVMARTDLPAVIWGTVIVGALITIGFTGFFGADYFRAQLAMVGLLGILIGLVIYTVLTLNFPFSGVVSVEPNGYTYLINFAKW